MRQVLSRIKSITSQPVLQALAVCALQFTLMMIIASVVELVHGNGKSDDYLKASYTRLVQWDSHHYIDIADNGYHVPAAGFGGLVARDVHLRRANVAYFPAYPLIARYVGRVLGIKTEIAVLVTAQVFCAFFWIYFFLLMRIWGVDVRGRALAACIVFMHPAAFFLICGYSESMFMAMLLGFIFWTERWLEQAGRFRIRWLLAAAHGSLLSITRLFGLLAAVYPFVKKRNPGSVLLAGVAAMGAVLFFVWCHYHFGSWDLYFKLQELGWGNKPEYLAIFNPMTYIPRFFLEDTVDSISRASIPLTVILFYFALKTDLKTHSSGIALCVVAFLMFYFPLAGKAGAKMDSMIRYTLPSFCLLVMCLARTWRYRLPKVVCTRWFAFTLLFSLVIQVWMAWRFFKGGWVA
ncbi:MAG: mannosyltransferase family protein [Bdellovibrionota bacterium]